MDIPVFELACFVLIGQYLISVGKDTEDHSLVWRKTLSLGIWLLRISCSGNMA